MTVYIEYAFAENFFIDFALLIMAVKTAREKINIPYILLSALIGTVFALIFPFFKLSAFFHIIIKILFGILLCLIAHYKGKIKKTIVVSFFFYLYTFCLGGFLTFLYTLNGWDFTNENFYIFRQAPFSLVLFGTLFLCVIFWGTIKKILKRVKFIKKSVKCKLKLREKEVEEYALLDSGNCLTIEDIPVSIISLSVAIRLIKDFSQKTPTKQVAISTVSGYSKINVFQIDEMQIYFEGQVHKIVGAYVGIGTDLGDDCSIILNSAYLPSGG